jgi:hypothetical protein
MHRVRSCGVCAAPPARLLLLTTLIVIGVSHAAGAMEQDPGASQEPAPSERRADFLFGRPHGSIGVRGSWVFARAGSDLFDFVTRELTLERDDFDAPGFGFDVAVSLTPRMDVVGTVELNQSETTSEYRDYVDNNLLPIEQTTTLKVVQLGGSLRYALRPRGHDVSRFAWVPSRFVPFVGAGGGLIYHRFTQTGDFVDFVDLSVFTDYFRSSGWSPSAHAFGGVDVQLYRGLYGTVEGRYLWAAGTLSRDFVDFDPIDLAGFRVSGGINLLF